MTLRKSVPFVHWFLRQLSLYAVLGAHGVPISWRSRVQPCSHKLFGLLRVIDFQRHRIGVRDWGLNGRDLGLFWSEWL